MGGLNVRCHNAQKNFNELWGRNFEGAFRQSFKIICFAIGNRGTCLDPSL